MQPVGSPDGKAQMGNVEARLRAGDGQNIAVLDGLAHQRRIPDCRLGNISHLQPRERLLLTGDDRHQLRVSLQRLVSIRVLAHIADADLLNSSEGRVGLLDIIHESHVHFVSNPVGEIVQSRGIALQFPTTIAQLAQGLQIIVPRTFTLLCAEFQGTDRLH